MPLMPQTSAAAEGLIRLPVMQDPYTLQWISPPSIRPNQAFQARAAVAGMHHVRERGPWFLWEQSCG